MDISGTAGRYYLEYDDKEKKAKNVPNRGSTLYQKALKDNKKNQRYLNARRKELMDDD
tara:strand:+ start:365 stop:538 length:174 start_codon:yes stop_codon:yes gene_type:complete